MITKSHFYPTLFFPTYYRYEISWSVCTCQACQIFVGTSTVRLSAPLAKHYDNTYKDITHNDFAYNDFAYNTDKCGITCMFLFTVISKVIYK